MTYLFKYTLFALIAAAGGVAVMIGAHQFFDELLSDTPDWSMTVIFGMMWIFPCFMIVPVITLFERWDTDA